MSKKSGVIEGFAWVIGSYFGGFLGSNLTDIMILNNIVAKYIIIAIFAGLFGYFAGTLFNSGWQGDALFGWQGDALFAIILSKVKQVNR